MHRAFAPYACLLRERNQKYKFYVQKGNFFRKLLQIYQKESKISMGGDKRYNFDSKSTKNSFTDIWDKIIPTQENYANTVIPKSFSIKLNNKTLWVSANATEHIYEYVSPKVKAGESLDSTRLIAQLLLEDMHASLNDVVANGIQYGVEISSGNWDFVINKPRKEGQYDAVIHAFLHK